MIQGLISRRLSSKLLLMTIGFVMLAELVIFIPSAAMFRQDWITERAKQASLLAQALTGVPDYEASEMLTEQFMKDTDVMMVATKRDGMTELILGFPPEGDKLQIVDLRNQWRLPRFRDAFADFFGDGTGFIRVLALSPVEGQDALELIIPKEKIRAAMREFFENIVLLSIVIAIITGGLLYLAMLGLIIRPIEKLAKGLADFREDPNRRRSNVPPGGRKDEIGQLQREFYDMKQSVRASFKQRERLATLGLAVAKINHDLRNVLTSAQLISDRLTMDKDERVANMGDRLTRAIDRGVKLTGDVLNFSQSRDDPPATADIRIGFLIGEAAGDTIGSFGHGPRKITFENTIPTDMEVRADPDHSYRIFHNLIRNASQAMAELHEDNAPRVLTTSAKRDGDNIFIAITDTGPGLPDKAKDNLFKAFTGSTGHGNTGLGLTISKELAEAQNGSLELTQTGPNGTTFTVRLPATEN